MKIDVGNIRGGGWAIGLDIGRLSLFVGDLVHSYGLRIVWYGDEWASGFEISTGGIHRVDERA